MESIINYFHEKLKKLGAERLMDNALVKLKGIGAVTGLMTNFQEKIKKTGADSMTQMKLKGMGAVSVSLMKNVQEKLNKTTDRYEVVNYLQKKFGWDLKNMRDNEKLKGIGAVTGLMTNFQEKIKQTEFTITFIAVLVLLVFLLGCIRCFRGGTAGKTMKAPGRKSARISRDKFQSNPRSYFRDLRGKKE